MIFNQPLLDCGTQFQEFIHCFHLLLAGNLWQTHLHWSYLTCPNVLSLPLSTLSPLCSNFSSQMLCHHLMLQLQEYAICCKASNHTLLCSVHVIDFLYLFWFPLFKERTHKKLWQSLRWKMFWETGFLNPLAYVKKGWFGPSCLIYCAYFDCCWKIAWTKLVMLLWEPTGLLLTCHKKQELLLGLCNRNKPAVFQVMLFFSFFFLLFLFCLFFFLFSIPRNSKYLEMLTCSRYNDVLCTDSICQVYTYLSI